MCLEPIGAVHWLLQIVSITELLGALPTITLHTFLKTNIINVIAARESAQSLLVIIASTYTLHY